MASPEQHRELDSRVAIVTGANHGIGAETARQLAAQGAAVLVTYLRISKEAALPGEKGEYIKARAEDAESTARKIMEAGGKSEVVEADLSDPSTPSRLFQIAEEKLGPVSILVNNASAWRQDTFLPSDRDRFGRGMSPVTEASFGQLEVDARGSALMIAEFARRHIAHGAKWGRIISLISGGAEGFPDEVSYGASKAALQSYTMSAAKELGRFGITANAVYPPVTDTGWITAEIEQAAVEASPFKRVAQPSDVAAAIVMLCTEGADYVTGNVVQVR